MNLYGCSLGDHEAPPQKLGFSHDHYVITLLIDKAWKHQPHQLPATYGGSGVRQIVDLYVKVKVYGLWSTKRTRNL